MSENKSSINWGGIVKTALAAGAILIGIELVSEGTIGKVVETISKIGDKAPVPKPEEAGWIARNFGGLNSAIGDGIGKVLLKIGGIAMAITGISYLLGSKGSDHEKQHAERYHEARESFALREDMRKMQTVMQMRMQAQGYEPAMVGQPARG
ncbi:MAG: hypothetical protein K2Q01_10175 [Rickettsiales bacterium]|nr:hypothetical protein [Rickettsiales bacterium]